MINRRERLGTAFLYLVCDDREDAFLEAALRGGVDIVQLRLKGAGDEEILAAGHRFKRACARYDALLIVNDRPDLAAALDADGAHIGQEDMAASQARELLGGDRLLGLSTHYPDQVEAAAASEADYFGVGPVYETPTKPGRAAVGLELIRYAAEHVRLPFFAIGGISTENVDRVRDAGAQRIAVVRALTEAADPETAARKLRGAVARGDEARVGAAQS